MRHRYRLTLFNLTFEQRNHRTVRAKHIAKAGRHKLGIATLLLGQELHNHFATALGGAHHIRRVHGLVGTDHHKLLDAIQHRKRTHIKGTHHIILDSFHRVIFHERHMLVRSRMEHHLWPIPLENLVHAEVVAHRRNQRHQIQLVAILHAQFLLNFVGVVFIDINNNHLLRIVFGNLAHEFGANRTATARDHTNLAFDKVTNVLVIKANGVAAQQVFHVNVANLVHVTSGTISNGRGIQKTTDKGQHLYRNSRLAANIQNRLTVLRRATRNGENNLFDAFFLDNLRNINRRACYQHTFKHLTNLVSVVVYQAYRIQMCCHTRLKTFFFVSLVVADFLDQHLGRRTSPHNHGTSLVGQSSFFVTRTHQGHKSTTEHITESTYSHKGNHCMEYRKLNVNLTLEQIHKAVSDYHTTHNTLDAA